MFLIKKISLHRDLWQFLEKRLFNLNVTLKEYRTALEGTDFLSRVQYQMQNATDLIICPIPSTKLNIHIVMTKFQLSISTMTVIKSKSLLKSVPRAMNGVSTATRNPKMTTSRTMMTSNIGIAYSEGKKMAALAIGGNNTSVRISGFQFFSCYLLTTLFHNLSGSTDLSIEQAHRYSAAEEKW